MEDVKVLAFDTGGTVLDWHAGLTATFAAWGAAQGIEHDWHALANEHRRRSLHRMTNTVDPGFNIDDVRRDVLGELFDEDGLGGSLRKNGRRSQSAGTSLTRGRILLRRCAGYGDFHDPQPVADRRCVTTQRR